RPGSACGTLDLGLRAGIGHGKQRGVGHTGDLVRNLGTHDRSRVHHLVARSLASPRRLRRATACTPNPAAICWWSEERMDSAEWLPRAGSWPATVNREKNVRGKAAPHIGDVLTMRF